MGIIGSSTAGGGIDTVLTELDLPRTKEDEKQMLLALFTPAKIQYAMFYIVSNKFPRNDRCSLEFFKLYWLTIGNTIIDTINRFLSYNTPEFQVIH